jgi:hypothetical protein
MGKLQQLPPPPQPSPIKGEGEKVVGRGKLSTAVRKKGNVVMNDRERVILFPLTLTLSPIGGEGIKKEPG